MLPLRGSSAGGGEGLPLSSPGRAASIYEWKPPPVLQTNFP